MAALSREGGAVRTVDVPWSSSADAVGVLTAAASAVARGYEGWRLAWCAGAGVIATSAEALEQEALTFSRFLMSIERPPDAMVLASSVGGVYGGSLDTPPFNEYSGVRPLSPYGIAKLAMEDAARDFALSKSTRVVLARLANLYGPGQNLEKPQGLISQLCLSQVTGRPLGVYASFDTLRDYVFAPDAAQMMAACLRMVSDEQPGARRRPFLDRLPSSEQRPERIRNHVACRMMRIPPAVFP